ncbi:MFS transporter [Phaeodactylibacter sp.]|uniref:MFS transporter n=1 Tax=Phaeodactylibacter sp. TaxID=1940289 RepID=UPI0025CC5C45|nr:MFS transporter [Phaeodactylibacter sp.]MCI4649846.1 MFS transporter [Phaeodactylibacter sp.]MCI5092262.1 MFS transporter [Phaeodactylibacter sp.]
MRHTRLLRDSLPLLAFGLLLTFFSSFGQTFLLSLYVPAIETLLGISNTVFGSLYAVATLSSAFTLPWLGGRFDRMPIRAYTLMVLVGLVAALLLLSSARHLVVVVIAFYGLRLFGQGLMSHTAVSAMARYFEANRGKAIGIATLGHPLGEATLPLLVTLLIGGFGWRSTLQFSALSVAVVVLPATLLLLRGARSRLKKFEASSDTDTAGTVHQSIWQLIAERRFWIITPLVFMTGYTNTALFFFQLKLGEARGWTPEWVAGSLSAFALASALGMAGAGPLVDRLSGRQLFPGYMIPYVAGLLVLVFFHQPIAYPIALLLMGLANGSGSTIKNAMLAEIYGIQVIGKVRSVFTTIMVISTALGPISFGVLLDAEFSYGWIFSLIAGVIVLTIVNGWRRLTS